MSSIALKSEPVSFPSAAPWFMLVSRSALFLAFQFLFALAFFLLGNANGWYELKLRPQLLPYFVIVHALMDISTMSVYWMV